MIPQLFYPSLILLVFSFIAWLFQHDKQDETGNKLRYLNDDMGSDWG